MSELSASAHVRILLADYAVIDPQQGKLTVVGGGLSFIGMPPNTNATAPFAVVATVDFAPKFEGHRAEIELALEQEDGTLVPMPGAPESAGHTQYIRVASMEELKAGNITWGRVPEGVSRPRHTLMLTFQNGLPLKQGQMYLWRVKIEDETRDEWTESMYVPASLIG
jgi:hypothetical protein